MAKRFLDSSTSQPEAFPVTQAHRYRAGQPPWTSQLGAHHYIDSTATDVAQAMAALGGASVVLATAANSRAMADTLDGLSPRGELVIIGVTADPLPITPMQLISPGLSVTGHPSGTARDIEETMRFAVLSGVRARIEERPLAEAAQAYAAMVEGRAHYRMVLTM